MKRVIKIPLQQVYLITYSQVNADMCPSCESFATIIEHAFTAYSMVFDSMGMCQRRPQRVKISFSHGHEVVGTA